MRLILILSLIWVPAAAAAFAIVKVFKIGPIILSISTEYGIGVHSGDFLALIPFALALVASLWLYNDLRRKAATR